MQLDEVKVPIRINCAESTIKFNQIYGRRMLEDYIQDIQRRVKFANTNLLKYLMCANDFLTIKRILEGRDK